MKMLKQIKNGLSIGLILSLLLSGALHATETSIDWMEITYEDAQFLNKIKKQNTQNIGQKIAIPYYTSQLPAEIQKKYDQYLKKFSDSETSIEIAANQASRQKYLKAIEQNVNSVKRCDQIENQNNSTEWLSVLKKQFPEEYLKKHHEDIRNYLEYTWLKNNAKCQEETLKNLVKAEAEYFFMTREQTLSFLKFYKTLNPTEQALVKTQKEDLQSYLKIIAKVNLTRMILENETRKLYVGEQKLKKAPSELLSFLNHQKVFQSPFDVITLNDAYNEAFKKNKP